VPARLLKLITIVAIGLVFNPISALAQEVTPTPIPLLVPELEGAEDAAIRSFQSTGFDPTGIISIATEVIRFDSADHAHDAMDPIIERQMARLGQGGDTSEIKPSSIDQIGDDTTAMAGTLAFADTDSPISGVVAGLVFARRAEFVFVTLAASLAGDAVGAAADVTRTVISREPGETATPEAEGGMRTGGLWEMLPTLDDLPSGLVFDEDRVPVPFEPLPGQSDAQPADSGGDTAETDLVPYKRTADVGESWKLKVVKVIDDPYEIDPTADWFTQWLDANPPAAGQQIITVQLRLTNTGDVAAYPDRELLWGLIGADGFEYRQECGQIPGYLSFDVQMRPGETIDFNACWVVAIQDIPELTLFAEPFASFDSNDRVLFALQ
jgi:hypothetical protein